MLGRQGFTPWTDPSRCVGTATAVPAQIAGCWGTRACVTVHAFQQCGRHWPPHFPLEGSAGFGGRAWTYSLRPCCCSLGAEGPGGPVREQPLRSWVALQWWVLQKPDGERAQAVSLSCFSSSGCRGKDPTCLWVPMAQRHPQPRLATLSLGRLRPRLPPGPAFRRGSDAPSSRPVFLGNYSYSCHSLLFPMPCWQP